jgi:uncharacterized protein YecE (DUF72 family)
LLSRHAVKTTSLPPDIRRDAETNPRGNLILTPELERIVAERILAEVEPLREAGKLGAFLLQLSPSFSPRKHKLEELEQLASLFRDERLAIELRNRNWLTEPHREETLAFFQSKRLPLVLVDAPESEHFTCRERTWSPARRSPTFACMAETNAATSLANAAPSVSTTIIQTTR